MAWVKTLPADDTKLRIGPSVIRDNWAAIENGEDTLKLLSSNLNDRTPNPANNDPAALAASVKLYVKQDNRTPKNQQIYAIDPNSVILQLTRFADFTAANDGYSYLPGDILVQWGRHTTTASKTQTVTFPVAPDPVFAAAPYIVIPMLLRPGTARVFCNARSSTNLQFIANTVDQSDAAIAAGGTMYWLAIGI